MYFSGFMAGFLVHRGFAKQHNLHLLTPTHEDMAWLANCKGCSSQPIDLCKKTTDVTEAATYEYIAPRSPYGSRTTAVRQQYDSSLENKAFSMFTRIEYTHGCRPLKREPTKMLCFLNGFRTASVRLSYGSRTAVMFSKGVARSPVTY